MIFIFPECFKISLFGKVYMVFDIVLHGIYDIRREMG